MQDNNQGYLARQGRRLLVKGYPIIPIKPGDKRPGYSGWENTQADDGKLRKWLSNGYAKGGVGILTRDFPAVDIDVLDEEISAKLVAWCKANIGKTATRVGMAPKTLLAYRAAEPFTKVQSKRWKSPDGKIHKVEILGDGQQYVAYATHPDTGKPYTWTTKVGLADVDPHRLPTITREQAQALLDYFDEIRPESWEIAKADRRRDRLDSTGSNVPARVSDDPLDYIAEQLEVTPERIEEALSRLDPDDGYDFWLRMGMALWHQFEGSEEGLRLWDEWSQRSSDYDADEIQAKWPTLAPAHDRKPVTAATILAHSREAAKDEKYDALAEYKERLEEITNERDLLEDLIPEIAADERLPDVMRERIAKLIQKQLLRITGERTTIAEVRKLIKPKVEVSSIQAPKWTEGWVYVDNSDRFFHPGHRMELTPAGYNAHYDRFLLTPDDIAEGRARPQRRAADVALNIARVPCVRHPVYMPGYDSMIRLNDKSLVNLWRPGVGAKIVEDTSEFGPQDKSNLRVLKRHFEILAPDERDRRILLDFISWRLQNPRQKTRWAVLIQGVQGDGKSTIYELMAQILGEENVGTVPATALNEDKNAWCEGKQFVCIEELKLHGQNRHEITNKLKPYITNSAVTIRRMFQDGYTVPNMTDYFAFTNYKDALPVDDNDRRYFVIFSRLQTKAQLAAFTKANPDHFPDLYRAIRQSPEIIRYWLTNRKVDEAYPVHGPAPVSRSKREMVQLNREDWQDAVDDILADPAYATVSPSLLVFGDLMEALEETAPRSNVSQKQVANYLLANGYNKVIARPRVPKALEGTSSSWAPHAGRQVRCWSSLDNAPQLTADEMASLISELEAAGIEARETEFS